MTRMKTTLEIPDDLFREAKAKAALEGIRLKDLVTRGLEREVRGESPTRTKRRRLKFPILKSRTSEPLDIPADAAFRVDLADEIARYDASLR